jgi:2'-5' RNA ligase
MRCFVGLDFDEPTRRAVTHHARALEAALGPGARAWSFSRPDSYHLTLKFLGAVEDARVPGIIEALRPVALATAPFAVTVAGLGAFPPHGPARIAWLGVDRGREPLAALAGEVERVTVSLGFPAEERPFAAHCTLARARNRRGDRALRELLESLPPVDAGEVAMRGLTFFRSDTTPKGAVYTPVAVLPFAGG